MNKVTRICAGLALLASSVSPAWAQSDLLVLMVQGEGAEQNYAVGAVLPHDQQFELSAGQSIVLLAGKDTIKFSGPGRFSAEEKTTDDQAASFLNQLSGFLTEPKEDKVTIGAVRGGEAQVSNDPWVINVTDNGIKCSPTNQAPRLWRGDDTPQIRASIEDRSSGRRRFFSWPEGKAVTGWPERLQLSDGGQYLIDLGAGRHRSITVVLVDPDQKAGEVFQSFLDAGCDSQVISLIQHMGQTLANE